MGRGAEDKWPESSSRRLPQSSSAEHDRQARRPKKQDRQEHSSKSPSRQVPPRMPSHTSLTSNGTSKRGSDGVMPPPAKRGTGNQADQEGEGKGRTGKGFLGLNGNGLQITLCGDAELKDGYQRHKNHGDNGQKDACQRFLRSGSRHQRGAGLKYNSRGQDQERPANETHHAVLYHSANSLSSIRSRQRTKKAAATSI